MAVKDWSTSAASNTSVGGVNIAPGMARSDVDNAQRATMAELRTYFNAGYVRADDYGLSVSNTAAQNATALLAAITALRSNSVTLSTDGLGSGSITAYASGVLEIGAGIFEIAPDVLQLTQDIGLIIKGQGSRRTTNYVRGRTVLLISGTSSGYGIQTKGNGARGLVLEDLDIAYKDANFTGDVLDVYSTPGVTLNRVYLGTHGVSAVTRTQTARSLLRSTYDEFLHLNDVVMDGAIDGWWSDDTREPSVGFSTFGGSQTLFQNVTVYDVTGSGFRHDGNRTRSGLTMIACTVNPIAVNSTRGVKFDNIDGMLMQGCGFGGSVGNYATTEWLRAYNVTGKVSGCWFGDLTKAGTLGGALDVSGNSIYCTDGFTVVSGPYTGSGNEFSKGTSGLKFSPSTDLSFNVGPDQFKSGVTYSYDIPADSAFLSGNVSYDRQADASTTKFRNVSGRVNVNNVDAKYVSETGSVTLSVLDTGRTILATGGSAQTLTLPTAANGVTLSVSKLSSVTLRVAAPAAGQLLRGNGAGNTNADFAAGDSGGRIQFRGIAGAGWVVETAVGNITWS